MMLNQTMPSFGTDLYMPHGYCYLWKPELVGLHVLSDALIALAYYAIPLTLFYFVRKRRDLPFSWIFLLFSAFIISCGTTHLMAIWTLWHPTYWVSGAMKLITAIVSLTTAIVLVPIVPQALALASPAQLALANSALKQEIAERSRIEAELMRSRDLREAIFNESADALFLVDPQTRLTLDCNRRAVELFQAVDRTQLIGIEGHTLQRYQFSQDELQAIEAEMQAKGFWSREIEYVTCQGNGFWGNLAAKPITVAGQVMNLVRLTDITERKQADLAASRLAAIVESSGDAIIGKSLDGTITSWNAGAEKLFGYSAAEVIDRPIALLFPPEHDDELSHIMERVKRNETTECYETVRVRQDGQRVEIAATISPIKDATGQVIGAAKVARDITAQKRVEQALQEREAFLRSIGDNIPNGYLYQLTRERDGRYHYTYVSAGIERVSGLKPEAVLADSSLMFKLVVEEDLPYLLQKGEESAQNLSIFDIQVREQLSNGEPRWLRLCSMPRRLDDGRIVWDGIRLDIDDLKQTEESLRQSEVRNRALIQAMPDLMVRMKQDGTYLDMQTAGNVRLLKASQMVIGNNIHTVLPTNQAQERMRYVQQALQTRELQVYEYQLRIDDQLQFEEARIIPCGEDEVLLIVRDVSERKHAEESLRLYERIVSATTDAIALVDRNYVYQVVNQAYLNWHGKPQHEVLGQPISNLLSWDLYETMVKPRLDQCLAGQVVQYELWTSYPTLGRQFLSVTYDPYFDANQSIAGVVMSLRNITKLKQAEVQLELQSIVVKNMAEGVCMVTVRNGLLVYTNPKFERMFGYDAGELLGQHIAIVNYDDRNANTTALYEKIARTVLEQGEATYEVHNIKKDGTSFWCQGVTSVFEHPHYGTVFVVVQQDITERKQAEAVIQASLQEKEVLLKEIHHRVKNNLSVVDGLLQMQSRRSQNAEVRETLKESQNRITSIALVHEKLYGSNNLARIDFAHYIADLTAHLFSSYNIHPSQIKLITQIDPILLDIDTAIPCGLIINELVSNALKYAFSNQQTGEIQVALRQHQDDSLALMVQDNGRGLPQNFDFKQAKTLGLSLIQGLVKQLHGTLEISSNAGTTIKIKFAKGK